MNNLQLCNKARQTVTFNCYIFDPRKLLSSPCLVLDDDADPVLHLDLLGLALAKVLVPARGHLHEGGGRRGRRLGLAVVGAGVAHGDAVVYVRSSCVASRLDPSSRFEWTSSSSFFPSFSRSLCVRCFSSLRCSSSSLLFFPPLPRRPPDFDWPHSRAPAPHITSLDFFLSLSLSLPGVIRYEHPQFSIYYARPLCSSSRLQCERYRIVYRRTQLASKKALTHGAGREG